MRKQVKPTAEQRSRFVALIHSTAAERGYDLGSRLHGRGLRAFAKSLKNGVYGDPYPALSAWVRLVSVPPSTKVKAAADMLGLEERDVAMALYGVASEDDAIAAVQCRHRDCANKREKQRRARCGQRLSEVLAMRRRCERNRAATMERVDREMQTGRKDDGTPLSQQQRLRHEYTINKNNMSETAFNEWIEQRKSETRRRCRKNSTARAKARGVVWGRNLAEVAQRKAFREALCSIRRARADIRSVLSRVKAIDALTSTPWGRAGFPNQRAWYKSGDDEAFVYMRNHWQIASAKRSAKRKRAGGEGISIDQWIELKRRWGNACAYCGKTPVMDGHRAHCLEVEHMLPLPIGPDDIWNVVPACKTCNTSKACRELTAWAKAKGIDLPEKTLSRYRNACSRVSEMSTATGVDIEFETAILHAQAH